MFGYIALTSFFVLKVSVLKQTKKHQEPGQNMSLSMICPPRDKKKCLFLGCKQCRSSTLYTLIGADVLGVCWLRSFWHEQQWECAVNAVYDLRSQLMDYYIFRVPVATEVTGHSRKAWKQTSLDTTVLKLSANSFWQFMFEFVGRVAPHLRCISDLEGPRLQNHFWYGFPNSEFPSNNIRLEPAQRPISQDAKVSSF